MIQYKELFGTGFAFSHRAWGTLAVLVLLPNLFGAFTIPTGFGFNFHFFQVLVFIAAFAFGPLGGALSGGFGSLYTAMYLNNPWIIIGNIILGFFAGAYFRKGFHPVVAVWAAFAVQLPWLVWSDIALAGMPARAVLGVVISLAVCNTLWAVIAWKLAPGINGNLSQVV